MCGRYSSTTPPEAMRRMFACRGGVNFPPGYNCAPTQPLPVVRLDREGQRELTLMRWGLIPAWSDGKPGYSTVNARAETVADKPAFREAFRRRRCLVPADGFYEWRREGRIKQPYRITLAEGAPFAMAGLWERWRPPPGQAGEPIDSFAVIVCDANELVRPIHDRMPVILPPEAYARWLAPDTPDAAALLRPYPAASMRMCPVGTRVNSPHNNDPDCLLPA